jgi:hypothetical protein
MCKYRCLFPSVVALSLLIGCVPNKIYRKGNAAIQTAPVVPGSTPPSHFKLGMIEFDDMGESWEKCTSLTDPNNCQLTRTLDLIRKEKQRTGEVVVVVFIHGWKNNASPSNENKKNLRDFKILMERLGQGEAAMTARTPRSSQILPTPRAYIGVYMAWRGQSVAGDLFSAFWNRRDAAERVGSSDFAEALYRIMAATKENSPNSRIVVVGHSFGARVLETALTNTFVSLLIPQPNGAGQVLPPQQVSPADLILYVNPATDSFRTKQMVELMKRTSFNVSRGDASHNGPLFLSVTSTGDTATGVAFPLGQGISATQKKFRSDYGTATPAYPLGLSPPKQKTYFTRTPGHIPYLVSHVVHPVSGPCVSQPDILRFNTNGQCFEMAPLAQRMNDSPFWVMTVPPAIIRDHVDIFNPAFSTMIIDLMDQYQVLDSPQPTVMLRAN